MTYPEASSFYTPYERLLMEGLGEDSPEAQNAISDFKNLLDTEEGISLAKKPLNQVLQPVKNNLALALGSLSRKDEFAEFIPYLDDWTDKAERAQSSVELGSICQQAKELLFPFDESDPRYQAFGSL